MKSEWSICTFCTNNNFSITFIFSSKSLLLLPAFELESSLSALLPQAANAIVKLNNKHSSKLNFFMRKILLIPICLVRQKLSYYIEKLFVKSYLLSFYIFTKSFSDNHLF